MEIGAWDVPAELAALQKRAPELGAKLADAVAASLGLKALSSATDDWTPEARALEKLGIVTGKPDGSFGRYAPLSRGQGAAMIYRTLKLLGKVK